MSFCRRAKRNDRLVTVHTSIARGEVWCKKQSFPGLPQTATSVTEEEENEDDNEKNPKSRMKNICSSRDTKVHKSLESIACAKHGSVDP